MKRKAKGRGINGKYLGLDPKSFALSSYHCRTCHAAFSSNQGIMIFCPACGVPAKADAKIGVSASYNTFKALSCKTCASELHTNLEPDEVVSQKLFCPECGDKLKIKSMDDFDEDSGMDESDMDDDSDFDDVSELDEDSMGDPDEASIATVVVSDDSEDDEDSEDEDSEDEDSDEDSDEEDSEDEDSEDEDSEDEDSDEEDSEDEDSEDEDTEDSDDEDSDEDSKAESSAINMKTKRILASPITDKNLVKFDLWKQSNGDMVRNVVIAGMPVARIHLSDQEQPEELSKIFAESLYETTLLEQMERKPVKDVLVAAEARFLGSKESKQIPVKTQVDAAVKKELNAFRGRFKETFLAVMAGANKNLFNDVTNTLKQTLWEAIAEQGVNNPEKLIEGAFEISAEPFLDQVFDKTVNLLEKGDHVRQEIIQMVNESGTVSIAKEYEDEEDTLRTQLAKASFPINIATASTGDARSNLRDRLKLRRKA